MAPQGEGRGKSFEGPNVSLCLYHQAIAEPLFVFVPWQPSESQIARMESDFRRAHFGGLILRRRA